MAALMAAWDDDRISPRPTAARLADQQTERHRAAEAAGRAVAIP